MTDTPVTASPYARPEGCSCVIDTGQREYRDMKKTISCPVCGPKFRAFSSTPVTDTSLEALKREVAELFFDPNDDSKFGTVKACQAKVFAHGIIDHLHSTGRIRLGGGE